MTSSLSSAVTTTLDQALRLAEDGLWLFPCSPGVKTPAIKGWQAAATRDPETLARYFTPGRDGRCNNVGIFTGKYGDAGQALLVIDVDRHGQVDGNDTLLELALDDFILPATRTHSTPNGGQHLLFVVGRAVKQGAHVLGPGLDIRSDGGYIIGPGSRIGDKTYTVVRVDPPAPAPIELIERCGRRKERDPAEPAAPAVDVPLHRAAVRAVEYLRDHAPVAVEGKGGDQTTFQVAVVLVKDIGLPPKVALDLMAEHWNSTKALPPWPLEDLATKIENASRYGQNAVGASAPEAMFRPVPADAQQAGEPAPTVLRFGTDIEIARAALASLVAGYGETIHDEGEFWRYGACRWEKIPEGELRRLVHDYDGRTCGNNRVRLGKSRIDSIVHEMRVMADRPHFFSAAPPGVNCASGFIEFAADGTPALRPHQADDRQRHLLSGSWRPGATWRQPDSLLDRLLVAPFDDLEPALLAATADLIGEVFGAAITGCVTRLVQPKAVVLFGATAENGKSQIMEAARRMLPPSAVSAVPPGKFSDDRYVASLPGMLLNTADELSSSQAIGSDAFKAIVTGEPVMARQLYKQAVTFKSTALHIFATNSLPSFAGGFDRGVQRRLLVLPFGRVIPKEDRVEHIGARVAAEEPDLLLAFAVEGASRLIARRYFAEPEASKAALQQWIFGADPVLAWYADRIVFAEGDRLPYKAAYHDFQTWSAGQGYDTKRLPAVNNFVVRIQGQDARVGKVRNNTAGRCFVNLRLLPAAKEYSAPGAQS